MGEAMKILIVDDKEENLILLDTLLKGFGYTVEQAVNGQEALQKLKDDSFQMVISDILMPVMDGYEFCRRCKSDPSLSTMIFVFYTATYTTKEDEAYALQLGADKFLIKPMEPDLFVAAIREAARNAEEEKVSMKHQKISDIEAIQIHRDRLLKKLNDKILELESEITQRKNTEEKYRKLMDFNPEAIFIHCEGKIVYANRVACRLLEAECPDSLEGEQMLDFIHPDFHNIVIERINNLLAGDPYAQSMEEKFVSLKKNAIDVEVTSLPSIYNGKQAIQILVRDITESKRAEERLQENERRLSTLMGNLPGIAYRCANNENWTMEYLSKGCYELTGYTPEEIVNNSVISFNEIIHPDFRDYLFDKWQAALSRKEIFRDQYKIITKEGKEKWVWEQGCGVYSDDNQVIALEGFITDITEQKQAEEALKQSEQKYRELIDGMNETVWVVDLKGQLIDVNRTAIEVSGYSKEELLNIGLSGIDLSMPEEEIVSLAGEMPFDKIQILETIHTAKDGREFPVEVYKSLVTYYGEQAILCIARDITERKISEEALRQSELRYQTLAEISPVGIFRNNAEGFTTYVNKRYCEISGQNSEEALGRGWLKAVHPDDRKRLSEEWEEALRMQSGSHSEYRFLKPDKSVSWVIGQAVPEKDEDGRILSYVGTITDITEHKLAEDQIQKDLEEKEVLLKEIHHRVKNNMQVIISIINLQLKYIDNDQAREILVESQNRIRSMSLVHNIFYQSKDFSKIDLRDYLHNLIPNLYKTYRIDSDDVHLKTTIRHHSLALDMAVPCGLLMNELISNALKHAFPEGRKGDIIVDLQLAGHVYTLVIGDNGIGLPEEIDIHNPKSFGLLMMKALVDQLNGSCEVLRDHGTTYTIVFKEMVHANCNTVH